MRETGGWDAWDMIIVEDYPCATWEQLHAREGYWMEQLGSDLNDQVPLRNNAVWYAQNRERALRVRKAYRDGHKEQIAAQRGVKNNCPCGGRFTKINRGQHERTDMHKAFLAKSTAQSAPVALI